MLKILERYNADFKEASPLFQLFVGRYYGDEESRKKCALFLMKNGANVLARFDEKKRSLLDYATDIKSPFKECDKVVQFLTKEIRDRKLLNKTIPLLFWASQNENDSSVYGLPEEIMQKIAASARNLKM